jgi:predicted permease
MSSSTARVLLRLLAFLRGRHYSRELNREIDAHLRLLEDDYVARGMSPEEARFAARRAFGGQVEQTKLRHRDARSVRWLEDAWVDVKLGVRMLVKYPGLTIIGGIGMAVGIAISTASFAFFYTYLYSTLPLPEGDRIVALENWDIERNNEHRRALHDLLVWRAELRSVQHVSAFRTVGRNLIIPGGAIEFVRFAEVTASAFHVTQVPPMLGRWLTETDEQPGAPAALVIGHDVWRSKFASDPAIVGRTVRLGHVAHTIVGVMPEGFLFPVNHHYWTPLRTDVTGVPRGEGPSIFIFGRLAPGATPEQAQAELTTLGGRAAVQFPDSHARLRPRVLPYAYPILDIQDVSLWQVSMMQAVVSLLLVVVAVNVAILVYARTATRQGELAVRTVLGASRTRVVGQLFVEALVLASTAAAVGLGIAKLALAEVHRLMWMGGSSGPYWINDAVPWPAVMYVIALTVFTAAVAGGLPALQATGRAIGSTLRALGGSTGLQLGNTWTVLIVAQVAFAVAALPAAIGMGWEEVRSGSTQPVFNPEHFAAATIAIDAEPPGTVNPQASRADLLVNFASVQQRLRAALEAHSWVHSVTIAARPAGQESGARVEIDGQRGEVALPADIETNRVDPNFFQVFGADVLAGRAFGPTDRNVVVVNRTFVDRVLGGQHPLGVRVRIAATVDDDDGAQPASPWYEIVGVVADLHRNAFNPALVPALMYQPLTTPDSLTASVIVRVASGSPEEHLNALREQVVTLDPTLRIQAYSLAQRLREVDVALRLMTTVLSLIIVSVLLLSAAGIYALMSFTVSQRRKEIGIRAALGADAVRLLRSIFARATLQLALGVAVGVAVALGVDALSGGTVMGDERRVLLPTMCALMVLTGLAAALGPARRGLRIDATQALREQ